MSAPTPRADHNADRGTLHPLGLPRPLAVRLDAHGEPATVTLAPRGPRGPRRPPPAHASMTGTTHEVERVEEVWRIAEEWWREAPLLRTYYRVLVDGGRPLTLFHDDAEPSSDGWYEQRY